MNKFISLKQQLAEAAKYIQSGSPTQQRLAVILLDNFVELQLTAQIRAKQIYDTILPISERKYTTKAKKAIFSNYDKLLDSCVKEEIITKQQSVLLTFCHEVRNINYHKGGDEDILTKVAVMILYDVIMEYQPKWQHGFQISVYTTNEEKDPFVIESEKREFMSHKDCWQSFLNKYFFWDGLKSTTISQLISDFLLSKLYSTRDAIAFIEEEDYSSHFYQRDWNLNQILFHYAFKREYEESIEESHEQGDSSIIEAKIKEFSSQWSVKKVERVDALIRLAHSIAKLPFYEGFEKFKSCRREILMIYHAATDAAADLSAAIESESDYLRGK